MNDLITATTKKDSTCFKMCSVGGAGSPGVKEMFGETKRMEQLMDHSLWSRKNRSAHTI